MIQSEVASLMQKHGIKNANGWPKIYRANHLEPGLVRYADLGEKDPKTGAPKGMTLLIRKPAIDRMRASFVGKPVINFVHKEVDPSFFESGEADGIVTDAFFNADDGWDWVSYLVWDDNTKRNCENEAYSVSCAYKVNNIEEKPGIYHNIPYDGEILDGEYTHLAIVANPRYEGARIVYNSTGGSPMKLKFWSKDVKNAADLDADKTTVEIDGKTVPFKDLLNAHKADEDKKAEEAKKAKDDKENAGYNMSDDTMIDIDGKEMPLKNLKDIYRNAIKNAEDEKKKKDEDDAKEKERKNAEEAALSAPPAATVPPGSPKEESEEKDKAAREASQAGLKPALANDAGKRSFEDLKNAAALRGEAKNAPILVSQRDKANEGKKRYGSGK